MSNRIHRVAAVQMQARQGDIAYNLAHIKELVLDAVAQGAEIIALPEFFTTSLILHKALESCALPARNNPALDLLVELASDKRVLIGGSYLEKRGADVYNCYLLVRPDGSISRHDKDLPTMVENAFYIGGASDGQHQSDFGRVGTAMCWETIRSQTVTRLQGRIDFLMTGSHWWCVPSNWHLGALGEQTRRLNRQIMANAPGRLAQLLGVPNIHAAHCGTLIGDYALLAGGRLRLPVQMPLLGETQIVDAKGQILQRLTADEGPGVIVAELDLLDKQPLQQAPKRFWIPELPLTLLLAWLQQRWASKGVYQSNKRRGLL